MAKKPLSIGVKAALIGAGAVIIAALVSLLHHATSTSQSVNNAPGAIQAGRDVIIKGNGTQSANNQFDTTLAKKYDEQFENMTRKRARAAIAIQEYLSKGDWNLVTNNTDALDDVLGFFDIMGYDEQHGLINPDVLHEYFCDDIMAYYQASSNYIAKVQKSEGETTFANIKSLFDAVVEIEAKKEHTNVGAIGWDKADLLGYFQSETNAGNLKDSK
jgi:hypothetical protein